MQGCGVSNMLARCSSKVMHYFGKIKKTMPSIINLLSGSEALPRSSFGNKGWQI